MSPDLTSGRVVVGEARALDEAKRSLNCSARDFLAAWWRGKAGPVPCAGCSACCYYAGVPVDKKRDRIRHPRLLTERNHECELVLQRRSDGACAHLGERGCTVYEHRPSACRSFDCRAFSAMGLVELRSRSSDTGLGVCRARASPAIAAGCRALRPTAHKAPLPAPCLVRQAIG